MKKTKGLIGKTEMKQTLKQRVASLEFKVNKPYIKDCPRCGGHSLNEWQDGVCRLCAYATDERLAGNYDRSREPIIE